MATEEKNVSKIYAPPRVYVGEEAWVYTPYFLYPWSGRLFWVGVIFLCASMKMYEFSFKYNHEWVFCLAMLFLMPGLALSLYYSSMFIAELFIEEDDFIEEEELDDFDDEEEEEGPDEF